MKNRSPFRLPTPKSKSEEDNNIAVVIGKTFESTTLPDGSQQITEVTKYKRLNDGYIYTESKVRHAAQAINVPNTPSTPHMPTVPEDKENTPRDVNRRSVNTPRGLKVPSSAKSGFKLKSPSQLACPSSLTLSSSSESFSSEEHDDHANVMSVMTEDYQDDLVEEYLFDNEERNPLSPKGRESMGSNNGNAGNLGGWCPSFDNDTVDNSLQLMKQNGLSALWSQKNIFTNSGSGFPDNSAYREGDGNGKNKKMSCKDRMGAKRCKVMLLAIIAVVISTIALAVYFKPSSKKASNMSRDIPLPDPCIRLQIVINTDENTVDPESNPDGDVNEWSLTRQGKNGNVVTIASSDALSPSKSHSFQHCVQPGLFTFHVSDSGGDGLGADGKGGYYIIADDVKLGVSSFFFHDEEMTFSLPFEGDEDDGDNDTACADDFFLVVKTDDAPEETSWTVVDNVSGEKVLEGGNYKLPWAVYTKRACLADGEYTLNIKDEGKDGMCCSKGQGFYMLYNDGQPIVNSDGEFGSGQSTVFVLGGEKEEGEESDSPTKKNEATAAP